jgi:O-antigen/teichoic acid export membrane protein
VGDSTTVAVASVEQFPGCAIVRLTLIMDSKRVINNSIALLVMDLSSKIVPLVTFPWIVRALGPESYGKVGFAAAVAGFFGLLASPGFTAYGVREAARGTEPPRTLVQKLMSARIMLALVSYSLLIVFTFTFAPHEWMTRLLLVLTGTTFLVAAVDVQWLYIGNSKMWRVSSATILAQFVYMAIILACVRRPADAWIVPMAVTTSAIFSAFILLNRARGDFNIGLPHYVPEEWGKFLPICVTLGVASMMSMIYDQIDTIMLRYLRSEAEVGIYVASYRLMAISMSFLGVLAQVFFPLFSGSAIGDTKKNHQYVQWMANNTIALALPIAAGGFLLAGPICAFVMGSRYAGADHLLRWLMLNLLSASAAVLFSSRLVPNNRERQYLWSVAAGAIANIILNLVFIPKYGAIAAVFTTIVAQATVAASAYYFTRDLRRADLGRPIVISLLASGIMAAAIVGTERLAHLHVVILIAGGALIYGAALFTAQAAWKHFFGALEPAAVIGGPE